jgi:single-stranded DNA-binding protein
MSNIETAFFGVLGRDAERKTSGSGKAYLRLNVRVGNGDNAQWIGVTTFDQAAIEAAEKLTKGVPIYVEGRLSLEQWVTPEGTWRHGLSVMSWHCRLAQIGRNKERREQSDTQSVSAAQRREQAKRSPAKVTPPFNDEIPF